VGQPAVALRAVTKRYGEQVALDRVEFDVGEGEYFAVLGPSGCGKTTLLRMVAGFVAPDSGTVELAGVDVVREPPHRRDVSTVFQSYALFPHLSVWDNVAYGVRRRGLRGAALRERVGAHLELVRMSELARRRPGQLSGGQQQRVALARALAPRPKVLLLDEPLGALDAPLRREVQEELAALQRQVGATFVHVTHDQEEALRLADRVAVLAEGRCAQVGTPSEVYEKPATRFVAGFVGSSCVLEAAVERFDGRLVRCTAPGVHGLAAPVPSDAAERPRLGQRVALAVRPEKVTLVDEPPLDWCWAEGSVTNTVYSGAVSRCTVAVPGGPRIGLVWPNAGGRSDPGAGSLVRVAWDPRHTVVLRGGS
jgi:spermidine/putrescine transport system ATP-binding protein